MAGASFFALFDDIALILDDVAAMTKVAAKKTAGVLGDDLAVNAEQVSGVKANRELPVVWAVAKGSFINKLFLVPAALAISVYLPWLIVPLLILGGLFLCFEGAEKILESFHQSDNKTNEKKAAHKELVEAVKDETVDLVEFEKNKIKSAIRTDFVLSAEIVIISLGTLVTASLSDKITVLSIIAIAMTIGVYGLVAVIVKLDDLGLYWQSLGNKTWVNKVLYSLGGGLLIFAPRLMQSLGVIGLVAMFLVGGGMLTHNIPFLHHFSESVVNIVPDMYLLKGTTGILLDAIYGILAGLFVAGVVHFIPKKSPTETV
ncbi:DUF808 domain-containing protein [Psychrosphaera sp. 1_MG-2023]|uniref:DUF808 domain-containing protein n=1 Tax=Psychrosphaera sp. 1_MG-2023 TaxID=3062643 RepID=UPI0026E19BFC|nr:DUF808 domain-containing protein [Psychrosphaera sp. 1_MG-2023]MDO6721014.1 DUF808 domain-containing protein [Psychrosphaera sp. 1_MG-2023]